jgi:N-acylneuraminate cytidylyltransferase/CMP-N,N'-diacetyllegionaminic acid synthase
MRPAGLATDQTSKWDVFRHLVEGYEALHGTTIDLLVDLDVTVPLKTSADIDAAIGMAEARPDLDVVITGYDPERNPYFNMMELREDGSASLVKLLDKPIVRRQDAPRVYSLTPAVFVVRRSVLYSVDHWSRARCGISPMPRERAVDIDSLLDLRFVEFLMTEQA